ncbi:hypothetical protein QWM81_12820 [Streptomyces ficellus]|uniref:Uncharacterized protein n=1 Tax=Streptomyces ficellus TaxID=1977088 RepID=A0ABT7Z601_9ACTN|nr:hypothetical protein [Streptomyces ficellus]MDN3294918.1 hypothetical protein [Streptomyces ficellus]
MANELGMTTVLYRTGSANGQRLLIDHGCPHPAGCWLVRAGLDDPPPRDGPARAAGRNRYGSAWPRPACTYRQQPAPARLQGGGGWAEAERLASSCQVRCRWVPRRSNGA